MNRSPGRTAAWALAAFSVVGVAAARPIRPTPAKPASGVKVMTSEADPNALAVAAAPALTQAAATFKTGRQALTAAESGTGAPAYSAEEIGKLLTDTSGAVQKALGEPELTPLRDHAGLVFRRARTALGSGGQVDKTAADRALDPVGLFLDQLAALATKGAVAADLCVISKPEPGARFEIRPAGDPAAVKTLPATDGAITAVRGLYAYRLEPVTKGKGRGIACGWDVGASTDTCLDLFDDAKTPLVCDFAAGTCQRAAGTCP